MHISLAHSPDPDDAFMFYALAQGKIDTRGYEFEHILQDIQTLNERASRGELDVTAVSIHAYAHLAKDYALLRSGASMGDGYGPLVVGKTIFTRDELLRVRIAIPGKLTSAWLALLLFLGCKPEEVNAIVVPFDQIFAAVSEGRADAGLIIHEGQLTYAEEGFVASVDLGKWWNERTGGLPLPLGGNAIRRSLGPEAMAEISDILQASIRYGLEHRKDGVHHAMPLGRGLDFERTDRFVGMYVNDLTIDYGPRGREGVKEFLRCGHAAGLVPPVEVEFI